MENPNITLELINDLEQKIDSNNADYKDYESIDIYINSIGGPANYVKNYAAQNGVYDFHEYIRYKNDPAYKDRAALGRIGGTIKGAISFLKSFATQNKLIS